MGHDNTNHHRSPPPHCRGGRDLPVHEVRPGLRVRDLHVRELRVPDLQPPEVAAWVACRGGRSGSRGKAAAGARRGGGAAVRTARRGGPAAMKRLDAAIPLGKLAEPQQIGDVVAFLVPRQGRRLPHHRHHGRRRRRTHAVVALPSTGPLPLARRSAGVQQLMHMAGRPTYRPPVRIHGCGRDELGQTPAVDPDLPLVDPFEPAVGRSDRWCRLDEPVMGPTQGDEIRHVRRAALLPGDDVVDVAVLERSRAPGKRAHPVAESDSMPYVPRCEPMRVPHVEHGRLRSQYDGDKLRPTRQAT